MKTLDQNLKFPIEPPIVLDFDINNACRICLVAKNLVSIFDDKYAVNNVSLAELLRECSNYEVKQHDHYPQRICKQCIENARIAYIFRKQCEISHKLINTIGRNNENDKDLEDISTQTTPKLSNSCGDCDRRLKTIKEKGVECGKMNRKSHVSFTEKLKKPVNYAKNIKKQPKVYNTNQLNLEISSSIEEINLKTTSSNTEEEQLFDMPEIVENASKIQKMLMKTCQEMIKCNKLYKKHGSNKDSTLLEKSFYMYNCDKEKHKNTSFSFECSDCKMKFSTPNEFQKHIKICKKDLLLKLNKIKTEKLSTSSSSPKSIKTNSTIGKKKYKKIHEYCKICNKIFTNMNTYRNHIKMHENPLLYSCIYCNKKYLKPQNLTIHIEKYHPDKSTIIRQYRACDICKKLYQSKELLEKHRFKKIDNKCPSCKLIDTKKLNSTNTINSSNNNTPKGSRKKIYICNVCNQEFHDINLLKTHQKSHISKSLYQCTNCAAKFETRTELIAHAKIHNIDKLYLCTKCGKQYSKLKRHSCHTSLSSVTRDSPYACKYCGKCFNRASDLITHKALHNDDKKPYICTTCGKSFQRSSNLVLHMRAHSGEKPYKCILCQKKFNFSNELKAHMVSHTEERYLCEHCNETFLQKVNLIQHQRNSHGINNVRTSRI